MNEIIADLKRDEGFRGRIYKCPADKWTVGYGRNLEDLGVTEEEAEQMLRNDVARVERELDRAYPWWVKCPGSVRRGLVNMAFNIGLSRLAGFKKMLACLQAGDYRGAAREALESKWAGQVGDRSKRIAELFIAAKGD